MKDYDDLRIRLIGEDPLRLFSLFQKRGYILKNIRYTADGIELSMHYKDFLASKDLFFKSKTKVKILYKHKLNHIYRARKKIFAFFFLSVAFGFLLYEYSIRIWTITVTGNELVKTDELVADLKAYGIDTSTKKSHIREKELAEAIREDFDKITWASVKVYGTFLKVDVRENRYDSQLLKKDFNSDYKDLVANKDGVIDSMIVRSGTFVKKIGDSVKAGDILVSGKITYLDNENQEVNQYTCADASVTIAYEKLITIFEKIDRLSVDQGKKDEEIALQNLENRLSKIIATLEEKGVTIKEKNVTIETNYEGITLYCTFMLQETVGVLQDGVLSDGHRSCQ